MIARKALIPVGVVAPDFTASASDGAVVTLSSYRGRQSVVLMFYPGDYTPVCTAQLCKVRDSWPQFQEPGAVVFGVNPLSSRIHAGFASRSRLPFALLNDRHSEISAAYGCRAFFGMVKRTVYVVDQNGLVAFAERGAPESERILQVIQTLSHTA